MTRLVRVVLSLCPILAMIAVLTLASLGPSHLQELPAGIQSLHNWLAQQGPGVIERARSVLALR